ncbi:class II glutamine amidotransferase [Haliangium ochraceum]|uniref:Glutamine amidotransferase type-2 domain-containing protein n=1 Tax=Haliangium ochraceum (strain DSM 14365 / JCM 11303 / SMP-2) TaxID=502025 RepID=D0LWC5_HALO1|nr:hypothetical protein [Haliangium ochraceum]ACY16057.1 hypothetical protein Hoch_3555 [Haliangium ochraceum DSM 14365]
MTRLLGILCNDAERLATALEPVRELLRAEPPIASWGMGYAQGGEVLLSQNPRPSDEPVDFGHAVSTLRTDCALLHASGADEHDGQPVLQPFRYRQWMYAQEGGMLTSVEQRAALSEQVPDFLQRNIRSRSTSELLFYLYLTQLHRVGSLEDPHLAPNRAREIFETAFIEVQERLGDVLVGHPLGSALLSNGHSAVAFTFDKSMYIRRLMISSARAGRDESFRGVLLLSAESCPGEGFEELPPRSAICISRSLDTDIAPLDGLRPIT